MLNKKRPFSISRRIPMGGRFALSLGGCLLAASILFALAGAAQQSPRGDEARGRRLALAWCSNCHAMEPNAKRTGDTLTFAEIARKPANSENALRAFLQTAHAGMPDWQLTRDEIDDLVAYIQLQKQR
jgi:mono/diheme cytochrome c family protein